MKFQTILCDVPWQQQMLGKYKKTRNKRPDKLEYKTMTIEEIASLPIPELCLPNAHIYFWTTNSFLRQGFDLLDKWEFKFLSPITWIKPSGLGNWFVNRVQICLMGYRGKCKFKERYKPNVIFAPSKKHSTKPTETYELIESCSFGPYIELFGRTPRNGWTTIGNDIDGKDIRQSISEILN